MRTSRVMLAGAVALAGGALAGCEKPAPAITVFSGTNSVYTKALCWAGEDPGLEPDECAQNIIAGAELGGAPELATVQGATVGISVDPIIAESGWTPAIGGQRLVSEPLTETYYRFVLPSPSELPPDGYGLQILAGGNTNLRGVWAVRLVRD